MYAIPVAVCQFINLNLNKFDDLIIVLEKAASVAKTFLGSQASEPEPAAMDISGFYYQVSITVFIFPRVKIKLY